MNNHLKGLLAGVGAAAFYGMNPLFAIPLYNVGMDTNSILFWRYSFAIPMLFILIAMRGRIHNLKIKPKTIGPLIILGILMSLSSLTLFISYKHMDVGIASTILFVYPLMVAVLMWIIFKQKLQLSTLVCILGAMIGIVLLYNGKDSGPISVVGVMWVILSAFVYALYIIGVNIPSVKNMPTVILTFYVLVFGWCLLGSLVVVQGNLMVPSTWLQWLCVAGLGLLPTAASLALTTVAILAIGSTMTALLGVFEPVTAVLTGVLLFGEVLSSRDIWGLTIILVSVSYVVAGRNLNVAGVLNRVRKMFPSLRGQHKI